jgi:hypothetical protein
MNRKRKRIRIGRVVLYGTGIIVGGALGYTLFPVVVAQPQFLAEIARHGMSVLTVGVIEKDGRPWI